MPKKSPLESHAVLLDARISLGARRRLMTEICRTESPEAAKTVEAVLKAAAGGDGKEAYREKTKEVDALIEELRNGPQRPGVFIDAPPSSGAEARAHVKLQDGTSTYPIVLDRDLLDSLQRGDGVLLSARAEAVLARDPTPIDIGEEARLETWFDGRVEISLRDGQERHLVHATERLRERLERGEVPRGSSLLVCLRRCIAWDAVPASDDELSGFRFLSTEPVPDVLVDRDVANPPAFIGEVADFCRAEMVDGARHRKYRLRRCRTFLLSGVSGSGKTLCISAAIRQIYEVISDITGLGLDEIPSRILRLRMSKLLSMWLGESDKNADRLADEIEKLSATKVTGPRGEHEVPAIVILEEFDGIARTRGSDHDQVYDRIQTTLLQRFDHTSNGTLRDRLVVIFATTNVPHLIDPAWLRRVGGRKIHFGRLDRRGFTTVLGKQLRDVPVAAAPAADNGRSRDRLVREVTTSLYSPNGSDPGLVEVSFAGVTTRVVKYRRDFLTGSTVDLAVQQAAEEACRAEAHSAAAGGLSADLLLGAFDDQLQAVARELNAANVGNFVDLPAGLRVADVRPIDPPAVAASDLRRW